MLLREKYVLNLVTDILLIKKERSGEGKRPEEEEKERPGEEEKERPGGEEEGERRGEEIVEKGSRKGEDIWIKAWKWERRKGVQVIIRNVSSFYLTKYSDFRTPRF